MLHSHVRRDQVGISSILGRWIRLTALELMVNANRVRAFVRVTKGRPHRLFGAGRSNAIARRRRGASSHAAWRSHRRRLAQSPQ